MLKTKTLCRIVKRPGARKILLCAVYRLSFTFRIWKYLSPACVVISETNIFAQTDTGILNFCKVLNSGKREGRLNLT